MAPRGHDLAAERSTEAGSFRDHDSRVLVTPDGVFRVLSRDAQEDWAALAASRLWQELRAEQRVVATEPAPVDAALLQLDLNRRALREDLTLKDASPYNVQWRGAAPVFIDVGSFERLRPDEPWAGYRQFCMLYLYPLMLQAYRDLPFHAALRGSLDGIPPHDARAILGSGG